MILEDCALCPRMMPHDVSTRWNSTFDMLDFAVEYREALDSIIRNKKMKLREYELDEEHWEIATKLRDVLKVEFFPFFFFAVVNFKFCLYRSLKMPLSSSHAAFLALPWLFLLWITLMNISQLPPSVLTI